MANEDLASKVLQDYPSFAWLLNDPEVGPLLLDAVNPEHPLDAATFQAKLMNTSWWKTHSAAQRQWQTLYNTDRAEYDRQVTTRHTDIAHFAASLGFAVPDQKLWDVAEYSLANGLSVDSAEIRDQLSWYSPTGSLTTAASLKQIAHDDYLMPLDDGTAGGWAREIAAGRATEDQFRLTMQHFAAQRFPSLADQIGAGTKPGQLFGWCERLRARTIQHAGDDLQP